MEKLIVNLIAIIMLMAEAPDPGGIWTWIGGGIILISVLDFLKKVYYEQENN